MKRFTLIITLFLFFLNCVYAAEIKTVTQDYKIVTKDGFTINATLEYPKVKQKNEFYTVVLLHSLGYSSSWWQTLPNDLLDSGYAVLSIDFRGHGKSVYSSNLIKKSWKNLTNTAYKKYPNDIITVLDYIKNDNKRAFFNKWAIVGADIGATTAIITANEILYKPLTIVMLSPVIEVKGLYSPVKLAELHNIDILSIVGETDINGQETNNYLKKFAQSTYAEYISSSKMTGMLMLKHDTFLSKIIVSWVDQYLK